MKNTITKLAFFTALIFAFTLKSNAQWREAEIEGNTPNDYLTFYNIQYVDANNVFGMAGGIYKSENGGDFFNLLRPNNFASAAILNNDNMFALIKEKSYKLLKSLDKGQNWDTVFIGNKTDTAFSKLNLLPSIYFFDNKHGFVFGDTINGCNEIWTTDDCGINWEKVDCNDIHFQKFYRGVYYGQNIFNVKSDGTALMFTPEVGNKMFKISNFGKQWDEMDLLPDTSICAISFKDSIHGVALRNKRTKPSQLFNNNIAITNDGGKTWDTSFISPDNRATLIAYAKPTANAKGFYVCAGKSINSSIPNDYVGSYVSFDDGKTWKQLDQYNHNSIAFYNAEVGLSSYYNTNDNPYPVRFFEGLPKGFSGIKNSENQASILVYPNPTKEAFFVEIESNSSIEIYDVQGKLCKKILVENGKIQVKTDELKSGTYFIKITDQKNTFNQKLIITE